MKNGARLRFFFVGRKGKLPISLKFLFKNPFLKGSCGGNRPVEDKRNCVWLIYQQEHSESANIPQDSCNLALTKRDPITSC